MSKWEWKKLKDVCVFIGDGDWIESKDQSSKGIRLIQTGNIGNGIYLDKKERSHYISETTFCRLHCTEIFPGDCLISRLPEPIGRACVIPDIAEKMITAVDCTIVRFCEFFAPNFFIYYAQSEKYFSNVKSESTGATRKRISRKNLENIKIPVPPLSEQKRIVKFLDEEFSKIDTLKTNAETNLKNAKELFETTLEKELNPLSRHSERSEESSADLPSGWEWKTLGDVCYRIKRGKAPKYVEQSDVLVFAQKCNQPDGTMSLEKALCLDPSILGKYKAEDYVKEGDVLVNSTGNGTVGRVGFFNNKLLNNKKPVVPDTHITTIRGLANTFPKYLYYFLKPKESYLSDKSLGTTNMKELHADVLEHLQIPLPPLSGQKEIVARLDKLSENVKRLEANYKQIIADCDELKKSILKKTFERES